jgi:riboflavin kinase/FMN adenylyltransferase
VTRATVDGKNHAAVTNIGVRPTFENPLIIPRVEPHLLDMQEQLYGKELTLEFIDFLRPEIKFENPQALVSQIKLDIEKTRKILQI